MTVFEHIWNEDLPAIQRYLGTGGDPNLRDKSGDTLLHAAIHEGSHTVVRELLGHGASSRVIDTFGNEPIHLATLFGEQAIIATLLDFGAELDATSETRSWTPLMIALNENHLELAQWMIRQGANPNYVDHRSGWTPLLVACDMGLSEMSMELMNLGARVDAKVTSGDIRGRYTLHLASYCGEVRLVEALLRRGLDVNLTPDGGGLSALHWAVYNGHFELMEFLLAQGADPNLRADGIYLRRTPLHYAVSGRQILMCAQLLERGANPLCPDSEGTTPYELAKKGFNETGRRDYGDLLALMEGE